MNKYTQKWIPITPEVRVELLRDGPRLRGIGRVEIKGVPLRSNAIPLRPEFATLEAIRYREFVLERIIRDRGRVVLRTTAVGQPDLYSERMDNFTWNQVCPAVRSEQRDRLDWILTPQEIELDGERYVGFSLAFRFVSRRNAIHRLTTVGTWEIGGRATGNTVYHQAHVSPPVYRASRQNHFSTACLSRLDLWHDPNGISWQMTPRWGLIQPFDFQAARQGVLLSYWPDRHSVKSLIQKNPGEDVLFVLDECDFKTTRAVTTPAKHILFSPSPDQRQGRPEHEVVNMWTRAMDHVRATLCGMFGITPCRPQPWAGPVYRGKNCVSREELARGPQPDWLFRVDNGRFYFQLEGDKIESHELLHWLADKKLPQLHAQGIKQIMFDPVHESDFSELAFACHAESGWHGDLHVASVCGTHRYAPAEFYGGWRGWHYLAAKARKLGVSLGHWCGLHISPRASVLRGHPEYLAVHANGLPYGGPYGHQTICAINWSSGIKQWFLDDLKRWHDEGGLEWLWLDSWPNLVCTTINYSDHMQPMQEAVADVIAGLQKIGYRFLAFEGTSPFGVHAYGVTDPMMDYEHVTLDAVPGQNDLAWWLGREHMGYNQQLLVNWNPRRHPKTKKQIGFRFVANRSLTVVEGAWPGAPDPELAALYTALEPLMDKRVLLLNGRGVLWQADDGCQALFAFKAFDHPVAAAGRVWRVMPDGETAVDCPRGRLRTKPLAAYRIQP